MGDSGVVMMSIAQGVGLWLAYGTPVWGSSEEERANGVGRLSPCAGGGRVIRLALEMESALEYGPGRETIRGAFVVVDSWLYVDVDNPYCQRQFCQFFPKQGCLSMPRPCPLLTW